MLFLMSKYDKLSASNCMHLFFALQFKCGMARPHTHTSFLQDAADRAHLTLLYQKKSTQIHQTVINVKSREALTPTTTQPVKTVA